MNHFAGFRLPPLCGIAKKLLHTQMGILFLAVAVFLHSYLTARMENPAYASIYYAPMVEYLLAGFVISVGSVALVDLLVKEQRANKK